MTGHRQPQADLDAGALGPAELVDDAARADEVLGGGVVTGLDQGPPAERRARQVGTAAGIVPGARRLLAGADPAGQAVALAGLEVVKQPVGKQDLAGEADVGDAQQVGRGAVGVRLAVVLGGSLLVPPRGGGRCPTDRRAEAALGGHPNERGSRHTENQAICASQAVRRPYEANMRPGAPRVTRITPGLRPECSKWPQERCSRG